MFGSLYVHTHIVKFILIRRAVDAVGAMGKRDLRSGDPDIRLAENAPQALWRGATASI
jgi:hypothetical protein